MSSTDESTKPRHLPHRSRRVLEGSASDYARMMDRIERRFERFTDEQLRDVVKAAAQVSTINCWCYTYRVAPIAAHAAAHELSVRKSRREYEAKKATQGSN